MTKEYFSIYKICEWHKCTKFWCQPVFAGHSWWQSLLPRAGSCYMSSSLFYIVTFSHHQHPLICETEMLDILKIHVLSSFNEASPNSMSSGSILAGFLFPFSKGVETKIEQESSYCVNGVSPYSCILQETQLISHSIVSVK